MRVQTTHAREPEVLHTSDWRGREYDLVSGLETTKNVPYTGCCYGCACEMLFVQSDGQCTGPPTLDILHRRASGG